MIWPLLLLAGWASAESAKPVEVSGYFKDLWRSSASTLDGRPYFLSTTRARLTLEARANVFRAHVDYDHEAFAGNFLRTPEFARFGFAEPPSFLTMQQTLASSATSLWRQRLYRGWAGAESDSGVLRFGRQRIAWGTGKLWNPTDILNPYQPLSLERDERRGVDALYARQSLGELSQAEAAYALASDWLGTALLGRAKSHFGEFDASLAGGKVPGSTTSFIVGGDFAGNLWGGTVHGEWSYTDPHARAPFWKADVGYEYAFPDETRLAPLRDATVLAEYFHDGSGAPNARRYLGLTYSKDVHPLLKIELALIVNCDDRGQFFSPAATWNALKDLYLTAGLQRFGGARTSEFGRAANVAFLQAQYYF